MVDVGAISAGLTSIKMALEITKELRNIDSSLKDAEVKLKLAELIEALSDAKILMSEMREENQELKLKIKKLENQLDQADEVIFEKGHYFLKSPREGLASGPFCAKCYSDTGKLIPESELPRTFHDLGKYKCPKCGSVTM
ncbi:MULTISPECIES: hypothetical protein [Shewanella]|uniref:Uncharacterized protein n=1 Tax=Shewanella xiamenensis TaxID=332186 RepID=A0ABT6UFA8_9GAMM|nr:MULTISPECIES: hypothetical protein [Shewanella]MCH7421855.1 hypothetical protein [Shewanella sp. MM_2022_3]MDI5833153.1 hypothetical protein [Shewanella xiamenensis]